MTRIEIDHEVFFSFEAFISFSLTDTVWVAVADMPWHQMINIDILLESGLVYRNFKEHIKNKDGIYTHYPRYPFTLTIFGKKVEDGTLTLIPV